jgi:membrane-associated phospholipid phosphatase
MSPNRALPAVMVAVPHLDAAIRGWVVAHQAPAAVAFFIGVSRAGAPRTMYILAAAGAVFLWYRHWRRSAAGVILATVGAKAFFEGVKPLVGRLRPPGLGSVFEGNTYSFPSAHSTASAAVCCALAFAYWRAGIVRGALAAAVAIGIPLLIGMSRVYLDAHWTTDVFGGWCGGLLIAVCCLPLFDKYDRYDRNPRPHTTPAATTTTHSSAS